jgi:DNA-3-methyladenine glycosylase II
MSKTDFPTQHLLATSDEQLKEIILAIPLPELESTQNVFHDLMSCVLEQQIHYRSTKKIFQRMLTAAGIDRLSLNNFELLEEMALGNSKLSANKYETIEQVLNLFAENAINWHQLSDEEVRKHLVSIKGISNWTTDMILLYTLKRVDVFPADDYHLQQIMCKLYGIDPKSKTKVGMKAVAEKWAPYRSTAVRYLFAWKDFYKKK